MGIRTAQIPYSQFYSQSFEIGANGKPAELESDC